MDYAWGKMWEDEYRAKREWRQQNIREQLSNKGFLEYVEAAKHRLEQHGFAQPFKFKENAELQDTWTTYIEYIEFVCWCLDRYTENAERLQPQHDRAWHALEEGRVLRESDTPESLCTAEARRAREDEVERAQITVRDARATFNSVLGVKGVPRGLEMPAWASAQINILQKAENFLEATKNRNRLIERFIRQTKDYTEAKRHVRHHKVLVETLLTPASQIRINEQKDQCEAVEGDQGSARSRKMGTRPFDEEQLAQPSPKQWRQGDREGAQGDAKLLHVSRKREASFDNSTAMHSSKRRRADKVDQTSNTIASTDAAVRKPTARATRTKTHGHSRQPPRSERCAAATYSIRSNRAVLGWTRSEWMKSLRKRPREKGPQQQTTQGR